MELLRPRRRHHVIAVALAVLVVAGGYVSLVVAAGAVMYSDSCGAADEAPICSARVQLLVALLPLAGWLVAVGLGAVGVVRSARRGTGGWGPMAVGVGMLGALSALAVAIAER